MQIGVSTSWRSCRLARLKVFCMGIKWYREHCAAADVRTWRYRPAPWEAEWQAHRTLSAAAATQPPGCPPRCRLRAREQDWDDGQRVVGCAHHWRLLRREVHGQRRLPEQCQLPCLSSCPQLLLRCRSKCSSSPIRGTMGDCAGTPSRLPRSVHSCRRCSCRHGSCNGSALSLPGFQHLLATSQVRHAAARQGTGRWDAHTPMMLAQTVAITARFSAPAERLREPHAQPPPSAAAAPWKTCRCARRTAAAAAAGRRTPRTPRARRSPC